MSVRSIGLVVALFFLFAAVACGGDDDDSGGSSGVSVDTPAASDGGGQDTSDDTDSDDEDPQPVDSGGSSGAGVGAVEADGQRFDVTEVRRCEPFFGGEDDLDLQAVASDGVILFVVLNSPSDALIEQEVSIQGGGLGVFGSGAASISNGPWIDSETDAELPGPPFEVAGDRVSGSLQLADPRGSGETLDVSFDIPIPSDIIDC